MIKPKGRPTITEELRDKFVNKYSLPTDTTPREAFAASCDVNSLMHDVIEAAGGDPLDIPTRTRIEEDEVVHALMSQEAQASVAQERERQTRKSRLQVIVSRL